MVDTLTVIENNTLSLSAEDLRSLVDWPEALIEDYLSFLRSLRSLAITVDIDIEGEIATNFGKIQAVTGAVTAIQKRIYDLEQTPIPSYGVFGAPPTIGNVRTARGYFLSGAVGTNQPRSDIDSSTPDWQIEADSLSVVKNSNDAVGPNIYLGKSRATENGGVTIVQDNDVLGDVVALAADGSDLNTVTGRIRFEVDDPAPAANAIGTKWILSVMNQAGVLQDGYEVSSELVHTVTINAAANTYVIEDTGGANWFRINTTANSLTFGNGTANPDYNFLGSGTMAVIGDMNAATLTDRSATLIASSTNLTDGAGVAAGTLTNAPVAGDPTKWVPIDDNGTTRYLPAW